MTKGRDGGEDPSAQKAVAELRQGLLAGFPDNWKEKCCVDDEALHVHGGKAAVEAAELVSLCGSLPGTVYTGIENHAIGTVRLQVTCHFEAYRVLVEPNCYICSCSTVMFSSVTFKSVQSLFWLRKVWVWAGYKRWIYDG